MLRMASVFADLNPKQYNDFKVQSFACLVPELTGN
jgi:hypothetical protein